MAGARGRPEGFSKESRRDPDRCLHGLDSGEILIDSHESYTGRDRQTIRRARQDRQTDRKARQDRQTDRQEDQPARQTERQTSGGARVKGADMTSPPPPPRRAREREWRESVEARMMRMMTWVMRMMTWEIRMMTRVIYPVLEPQ